MTVAPSELRNIFNHRSVLSKLGNSYQVQVVKNLLNVITSARNRRLPAGWIVQNRELNGVKSEIGVLASLGYMEKVHYDHKLEQVIFNDVQIRAPSTKMEVFSKRDEKDYPSLSFMEFRAGVSLVAPRLNTTSGEDFVKQMKRSPLDLRDPLVISNFNDTRYYSTINSLNRAHAALVAVGRGSKTKPIHFQMARNTFLHSCAKVPIKDFSGVEHGKISDLPKPVLDFCSKYFRFKLKSKRDASSLNNDEAMDVDSQQKRVKEIPSPTYAPQSPTMDPRREASGSTKVSSSSRPKSTASVKGKSTTSKPSGKK